MEGFEETNNNRSELPALEEVMKVHGDDFFDENEATYWHRVMDVVLNNLPVILCRIDHNGNFKKVTGKGLMQTGLSAEDFTGKNIFDIYPQISSSVRQLLQGKAVSFITSINHSDNKYFFENYYFPEKNGSVGFILDITDRKLAEEKIKKSESILLETQELAHIGTWEWEPASNKMRWSNELLRIFQYSGEPDEIKYLDYIRHIHPDDVSEFRKTIGKVFEEHRSFKYEHRIIREDGQERVVHGQGKPVINDFGIVRIYGFCQDITERKAIEEQLKTNNAELHEAKQALLKVNEDLEKKVADRTAELSVTNDRLLKINCDLDNFVYAASHDLKAPIANIEGLIQTLAAILPETDEDVSTIIQMIDQSVGRFKNTITDLAEIAKLQSNTQETEEVDLLQLSKEIEVDLANIIKNTNASILYDFEEAKQLKFTRKNLRSILYNLTSNAIKYHSPDRSPEVQLRCRRDEKGILLEVQDNGLGLDQDQVQKIFMMFKRVHSHVEGTGIGLFLVNRIVDNNGGRIEVESLKDVGTTFRIYLNEEE